jgi:hypothetical protein
VNYAVYGVEFSPNSNLLYYDTIPLIPPIPSAIADIYQVDLTVPNPVSISVGQISNQGGG